MKKARIITGLGIILVIGLAAAFWHYGHIPEPAALAHDASAAPLADRPAPMPSANHPAEATMLVDKMREWRALTDKDASDQMQIWLSDQITDTNAVDFVRGLPPELLQTPVGLRALSRWAGLDRRTAVEWLASQKNPTPFQLTTALHGWGAKDTEALHSYIDSLPEGPWKQKIRTEASWDALRYHNPMEALTLLRDLEPGEVQTLLAKSACAAWAEGDPASAAAWADKVEDPGLKKQLLGSVAIGAASSDPQSAATWLLDHLPSGPELQDALDNVAQVWVRESKPEDAAVWVAQLPAGETRQAALKGFVSEWRRRDPGAFANWMKDAKSDPLRQDVTNLLTTADARGILR